MSDVSDEERFKPTEDGNVKDVRRILLRWKKMKKMKKMIPRCEPRFFFFFGFQFS